MLRKPKRLLPGDTIGVVAPCSPPNEAKSIDKAIAAVERLGFRIKLSRHARKRFGFLAGSDAERAGDLAEMFGDKSVSAIVCLRGGYGSGRLLPLLDYSVVSANPKIFVGYSDVTALHSAFVKKCRMVTFHGPMLASDFVESEASKATQRSFVDMLTVPGPKDLFHCFSSKSVKALRTGVATGRLIGGNVSILCSLLGTPYQVDTKGAILLMEDVNEASFRYDRMLTQLLNAGVLQRVAGIAIGVNTNCSNPPKVKGRDRQQSMSEVLQDRLLPLGVPVVAGFAFGHTKDNATLPMGVRVTLDGDAGTLISEESAVI